MCAYHLLAFKSPGAARLLIASAMAVTLASLPAESANSECDLTALNPNTCRHIWSKMGLPDAVDDVDEEAYAHVCHLGYLARHNAETQTSDWVVQTISRKTIKKNFDRPKIKFSEESCVSEEGRGKDSHYKNSKMDRGHLAASEDFAFDEDWMKDTFVFSNTVPQVGVGFNQSIWKQFEELVRDIAERRKEVIVLTGPIYQDEDGEPVVIPSSQNPCGSKVELPSLKRKLACGGKSRNKPNLNCSTGVAIPAGLFKIIYDPKRRRVNAYVLPNLKHPNKSERGTSIERYLNDFQVSVRNIEERIGYDVFASKTTRQQKILEESCQVSMIR